jgi:hypothetical protein
MIAFNGDWSDNVFALCIVSTASMRGVFSELDAANIAEMFEHFQLATV